MSEEFSSVSPDIISDYLEGKLSLVEEKALFQTIKTVEDLWGLAQMTKIK